MVFKSDEQRKGFFGNMGNVRSNISPKITRPEFKKIMKTRQKEREEQFKSKNIKTVADVISLNKERGQFFFSPDTIKFFNSKILGGSLKGKNKNLFITSEKRPSFKGETTFRKFSIRKVNKTTGSIETVGEFQQFGTQNQANNFIKEKNI